MSSSSSSQPLQSNHASNRPRSSLPSASSSSSSNTNNKTSSSSSNTDNLSRKPSSARLSLDSRAQLPSQRTSGGTISGQNSGQVGGAGGGGGRRLTNSISNSSLRSDLSGSGLDDTSNEVRMSAMERRLKNFKADTVGLAKDILGLCEENVRAINRVDGLGNKLHVLEDKMEEEVVEARAVKVAVQDQESHFRSVSSSIGRLVEDVASVRDSFAQLNKIVEEQAKRISSPQLPVSAPAPAAKPVDLGPLLARLSALEDAAKKHAAIDPDEEDRKREHERKRAREAKDREDRVQTLLGEALQRNLILAARIRELESSSSSSTSAQAPLAPADKPSSSSSSSPSSAHHHHHQQQQHRQSSSQIVDDKPPQLTLPHQTPAPSSSSRPRKSVLDNAAPSLPAIDPLSPFVLPRTVKRGEKDKFARVKSSLGRGE